MAPGYYIDVQHPGLGKFRRVTGSDPYVVEQKAREQAHLWDQQWTRRVAVEESKTHRLRQADEKEASRAEASRLTLTAEGALAALKSILWHTLSVHDAIDWEPLYDRRKFPERKPGLPLMPDIGDEPHRDEARFRPAYSLFSTILPPLKRKRDEEAEAEYHRARKNWHERASAIREEHQRALQQSNFAVEGWQRRKEAFEAQQALFNTKIDEFRQLYMSGDQSAVIDYTDQVLSRSQYPDLFPKQWLLAFAPGSKTLVVDYELPSIDALPTLKAVKYIASRNEFSETYLRQSEIEAMYDDVIYQACLRTIHEIFESDTADAVEAVTFNGWVNFLDRSKGTTSRACIVSVQTSKPTFNEINLAAVDPKVCFRSLKGVGSSKLAGMSAVVPILRLNRTDERFVSAREVIGSVEASTNIAAISWEEFEHLVREVFEREFSAPGGEVRITRASRDHGVDAIAFDPDPIRGGKIVIQAKRYTNTVGVSAVRDLYGTVINEGANRGILVTTSTYGSDSYGFAKDKPLTLLDGGNLLSLLEKHGHKARIDLAEAKKLLTDLD